MDEPLLLLQEELCVDRPFTHPWYVAVDHTYLTQMFRDLNPVLTQPHVTNEDFSQPIYYFPDKENYHKRIILLDATYLRQQQAVTVIGFFGNKRRPLNQEIIDAIEDADRQLTEQFRTFADLVCYYSLLLSDSYNYANLVLLKRPEGIVAWNAQPLHQEVAQILSPHFYENVRIYQGEIPAAPTPRVLTLNSVKYWDFQSAPTWRAIRRFTTP